MKDTKNTVDEIVCMEVIGMTVFWTFLIIGVLFKIHIIFLGLVSTYSAALDAVCAGFEFFGGSIWTAAQILRKRKEKEHD